MNQKTDWSEYFRNYRKSIEAQPEQSDAPIAVVTEEGHEVEVSTLPRNAAKLFARLESMGFEVKAGSSETFHEGVAFLTGDKEGEKRADKTVIHYFVQAKHEQGFRMWASWEDGTFKGALYGEKTIQHLIDSKQKERTGETLTGALERVLQDWEEMLNVSTLF